MDKAERLALAVRAEVAAIRAQQARERHVPLERRAQSVFAAVETLKQRHGEDMDPADHVEEFGALVAEGDWAGIPLADVLRMLAEMSQSRANAEMVAANA